MSVVEYRCKEKKPNGDSCNTLFFKGRFKGEITVKCHRCNGWNTYHGPDYTASKAQPEDWAPLTV